MGTGTRRASRGIGDRLDVEAMEGRTLLSGGAARASASAEVFASPPVDRSYVDEVYLDALGRRATAAEVRASTRPGASPSKLAGAVFGSSEYRSALVGRYYRRYLDVEPDAAGRGYWERRFLRGATEQDVIAGFLASPAYRREAGGADEGFVAALYRDLLGRRAREQELAAWTRALEGGTSARRAARGFLRSPEFLAREVTLTVGSLLAREATAEEVAAGVRSLRGGRDLSSYRRAVASGAEYVAAASAPPVASPLLGDTGVPDLARLGYFDGSTFVPVASGSIGGAIAGQGGTNLYVLVHGWAPGYRSIVDANSKPGDPIDWWQLQGAVVGSTGAYSPWLYQGTQGGEPYVSPLGLAQSILAFDPKAVVLAFSWVDDSATNGGFTGLLDASESEARTQVNGLRMAGAIEEALAPDFASSGGRVHLMGHSHGTKVATVAAAELARVGKGVQHLTVFDSPDDDTTDVGDASNLLWYYLPGVSPTRDPLGSGGTFVDSYISEFASPYAVYPGLAQVVDVTLESSVLYSLDELSQKHGYGPYWYAGASGVGQLAPPPPRVAIGWSPLIDPDAAKPLPAESAQSWTQVGQPQFALNATQQSVTNTEIPTFDALDYEEESTQGNVTVAATSITLSETGSSAVYQGKFFSEFELDGITFDVQFTAPGDGDQLVVSVAGDVAFVIDGLASGTTTRSVAVSLGGLVYDPVFGHDFTITLASNGSNTGSTVVVSNLREFEVESS